MQLVKCSIGNWEAEARIQEVDNGKTLAIISAHDQHSHHLAESKHTVVFEHQPGYDRMEETKNLMQKIFLSRYGSYSSAS